MEKTSSQPFKNKCVNMQYYSELKGNTKAAEGLKVLVDVVELNQKMLEFSNSQCPIP